MKTFIQIFLTLFALCIGCVAIACKAVGTMGSAWAGLTLGFAALVLLLANRQRIVGAFDSFRAGQLKAGVFALLLFAGVFGIQAYQNIEDQITSLVIRPSGARTSDTNGLIRLYSANESNFLYFNTNLSPIIFGGQGSMTGITASLVCTQAGGIVLTANFVNGLLVTTNGSLIRF